MKGVYILIIRVDLFIKQKIGGLGKIAFPVGLCGYAGSAQTNLELQVARHLGTTCLIIELQKKRVFSARKAIKWRSAESQIYLGKKAHRFMVSDVLIAAARLIFSELTPFSI